MVKIEGGRTRWLSRGHVEMAGGGDLADGVTGHLASPCLA